MLFLLFHLGADRYALDAGRIAEVLPLVLLKEIPGAPVGIAGALTYRGAPVPVLDVSRMILGRPARRVLGTRLVLARYGGRDGREHLLGLIVERVTRTIRREPGDFVPSGVTDAAVPCLGPVASDAQGLIQRVEIDALLSADARDALFQEPVSSP